MKQNFKPNGYNSLSPYFVIKEAKQFVEFLQKVFDAQVLRRYDTPEGLILHMEMKLDDSVIMFADSTESYPPNNLLVHLYVPDVNETYKKAIEYGCNPVQDPVQKEDDPDIRGMFTDFAGNLWAVGTQNQ